MPQGHVASTPHPPLSEALREAFLPTLVAVGGFLLAVLSVFLPIALVERDRESTLGLIRPFTDEYSWLFLTVVAIPPAAFAGLLALLARRLALAGGLLVGVGAAGYLVGLAYLGYAATYPGVVTPKTGPFVLLGGAGLLLASGILAYGRCRDVQDPEAAGSSAAITWLPRLLAAGAAVLLVVGTVLPYDETDDLKARILGADVREANWFALVPVGVAILALAFAVFAPGDLDPRFAFGFLFALGAIETVDLFGFVGYAKNHGDLGPGGVVGLAGAVALALAGCAALLARTPHLRGMDDAATLARPRADHRGTETTRFLCAAAQLDERFATKVISDVIADEHRAVAPSYAVDLVSVLRHCVAASRRKLVRDLLLALMVVPALLLLAETTPRRMLALAALLGAAWAIVAVERWVSVYRTSARHLAKGRYDPDVAAEWVSSSDERKIQDVAVAEGGNVTIYSGYRPFVGSGFDRGGWSFALTLKGKRELGRELEPKPFTATELYDRVAEDLRGAGLEGFAVEDRLYVDGQTVRDDPRFAPGRFSRPSVSLDDDVIRTFVPGPGKANRYYRCLRLVGWQGEFVLSTFLNFSLVGRSLFAEARYFLLAPLKSEHLHVDSLDPDPTARQRVGFLLKAFPVSLWRLVAALPRCVARLIQGLKTRRSRRATRHLIRSDPTFDFGAVTTVRELAQADRYRRYFQEVDGTMFGKVIESGILESIVNFLDEHDVDTSDLEQRQTAILNQGVIVSGGSLHAESLAVGTQARATVASAAQRVRGASQPAAGNGR